MTDRIVVLIGDIVLSRKIKDRVSFDSILMSTLNKLSHQNPAILSPYTLTIGDEIQAVFNRASFLFHDAVSILAATNPEKMRFSIGVGVLNKPINPELAIGMDGPAFYNARDGIGLLKKTSDLFYISGDDIPHLDLLRQTLSLISSNMIKWNKTRLQTLEMLQENVSVKEIATRLQISDRAVYKTLNAGALEVIGQIFKDIEKILDECI
jgi:hypothetical protein